MPLTRTTTVAAASEQEILDWISARVSSAAAAGVRIGIGDDAAVLSFRGDGVATTDTLVHGPDFRLAWSSGSDIGWKAIAVNVADVAAMGAEPTALLVALTLPPETTLGFLADLYDGMGAACAALAPSARIVGGDLTVSPTLMIAITAMGDLAGRPPVTRAGARPGDVVAVAGEQGRAVRGLDVLFRRFRSDSGPIAVDRAVLSEAERVDLDRQLRPRPPVSAGVAAAEAGVTAMMDVSDGLVLDARRMARASSVRIDIAAASLGDDPESALFGGEDHALLATFPASVPLPAPFRAIGLVHDGAGEVTVDGRTVDERGGWDPYQDWDDALG